MNIFPGTRHSLDSGSFFDGSIGGYIFHKLPVDFVNWTSSFHVCRRIAKVGEPVNDKVATYRQSVIRVT